MNTLDTVEDTLHSTPCGELRCIFALITGDNVEFNFRSDHGLHELVSDWLNGFLDWLLDSAAPIL